MDVPTTTLFSSFPGAFSIEMAQWLFHRVELLRTLRSHHVARGLRCPNSQLLSWPKPLGLLGSWVGALAVISTMMDLGVGCVACRVTGCICQMGMCRISKLGHFFPHPKVTKFFLRLMRVDMFEHVLQLIGGPRKTPHREGPNSCQSPQVKHGEAW